MEPAVIVFIVLLGCYTVSLLYLNARVNLDEKSPGGVEEAQKRPVSQMDDLLKTGVSGAGVVILALFVLMILVALLFAYALVFDSQLIPSD